MAESNICESRIQKEKEWKEYNEKQEKWEDELGLEYSETRKCEHCGTLGFTTKRIKGLGRKIILQGYTLGGIKNYWYYECRNKDKCERDKNAQRQWG